MSSNTNTAIPTEMPIATPYIVANTYTTNAEAMMIRNIDITINGTSIRA